MTNFNIDNERPDMQLANDRAVGTMRDNDRFRQIDQQLAAEASHEWGGEDTGAIESSIIIERLIRNGGGRWLGAKSAIYCNHEISDVIDHIAMMASIIPDGWGEPITEQEQVEVIIQDSGDQVEIMVILHE